MTPLVALIREAEQIHNPRRIASEGPWACMCGEQGDTAEGDVSFSRHQQWGVAAHLRSAGVITADQLRELPTWRYDPIADVILAFTDVGLPVFVVRDSKERM